MDRMSVSREVYSDEDTRATAASQYLRQLRCSSLRCPKHPFNTLSAQLQIVKVRIYKDKEATTNVGAPLKLFAKLL